MLSYDRMDTPAEFAATYQHMSDGQLLQTANEGALIGEARQALHDELHRRNLKPGDLPRYKESPRTRLKRESAERELPLSRGGTGYIFFGRHYLTQADREANIQLRTKWISISYLPIVPLASFRFKCKQQGWKFFSCTDQVVVSKVPLNWNQVFLTWLKASPFYLAILALLVLWITHR
jgi:hypothetical protein